MSVTSKLTDKQNRTLTEALSGSSDVLYVRNSAGALPQLDELRLLAAENGKEVRLQSDASDQQIAAVRQSEWAGRCVELLAEHGLGLRVLPASYAPDAIDRARLSVWLDPEEAEVRVGLTNETRPAAALVETARTLALAESACPGCEGDAVRQAFALGFAGEAGVGEWMRCAKHLRGQIERAQIHNGLTTKADVRMVALRCWALEVSAPDSEARELLHRHVHVLSRAVATLAAVMMNKVSDCPALDTLDGCCERLAAVSA